MNALRIIALPRDRNPYQGLLYGEMSKQGCEVRYAGELTRSRSINLILLPLQLIYLAIRGFDVLHIHWTYGFSFAGAPRLPIVRRLSRAWFTFTLRVARMTGLAVVWTVHNLLPHQPVFDDDTAARRTLVSACDLVLAHSPDALVGLERIGAAPGRARVTPHASIAPEQFRSLAPPAFANPRTFLFLGRIEPYKGVEQLIEAARTSTADYRLLIAGECADKRLRDRIEQLASVDGRRVELRLEHIPDAELPSMFERASFAVYPFVRATTSGSVLLGLAAGRPLIVPSIEAFAELPDGGVIRYVPGAAGLSEAIASACLLDVAVLSAMAQAASAAGRRLPGWSEMAAATTDALLTAVRPRRMPVGHEIDAR